MKISSRFEFIAEFSWNWREIWRLYSWWAIPLKVKKVLVYLTCWARGKARRLYSRPQRNWKERKILLLLFPTVFVSDLSFIFSYKNNYYATSTIKNSRYISHRFFGSFTYWKSETQIYSTWLIVIHTTTISGPKVAITLSSPPFPHPPPHPLLYWNFILSTREVWTEHYNKRG
jgi:hypothetical protein